MVIDLSDDGILNFLKDQIGEAQLRKAIIYRERQAFKGGTKIPIGKKAYNIPFDAYMVFVDLEPKANWEHQCIYFFIDAEGKSFERSSEKLPPYFREFPETWVVIQRYGEEPPHDRYFQVY